MYEFKRLAFLRMMVGASMNDVKAQLGAFRDLGALPADTDLDEVIAELGLDGPPVDPTQLTQEEMLAEIQKAIKALLGYGARMPKELMLFVKNMVFLDGAIASLAPDLDLFAEIARISMYFAETHGERIAAEVGIDPRTYELDMTGIKGSFGVDPDETNSLTYRELQERREIIRQRMQEGAARRRKR
jgi:ubiquinone biosynthesis protein